MRCTTHLSALVLALGACTGEIGEKPIGQPGPNNPNNPNNPNDPNDPNDPMDPIDPGAPFVASVSVGRRLSQAELDSTLADLVFDTTQPASHFISEDEFKPFDNDYTVQLASAALIDSMEALTEDVAERAMADMARRNRIVGCTPTGAGDTTCFRTFIQNFGHRAFRRPLAAAEVDRYMTLQAYSTEQNQYVPTDFYTGVGLVIRAMLMDPEFLYRIETGAATTDTNVFSLNANEIASRMSYLLWGTMPDDALFADADSGALLTPEGRRTAATRMLGDDRAKSRLHRFHSMWLGYRAIPGTAQLVAAFDKETTALIDRVVFERKESYLELFRSRETYVDDFLADHYGFPRPAGGEGWVTYNDDQRAGILSHGSVLAAFSKGFGDTSPTQRGILIRSRLMCLPIMPPPPNVNADRPPPPTMEAVCKKDRYLQHESIPSCNNCHSLMDPIGFGLESYDVEGRHRTTDDGLPQCTIEGIGTLPGFGQFSGPRELSEKLATEHFIERCATQQYYEFAIGRALDASDAKEVTALVNTLASNNYALDKLITEYIASAPFALRKEGGM